MARCRHIDGSRSSTTLHPPLQQLRPLCLQQPMAHQLSAPPAQQPALAQAARTLQLGPHLASLPLLPPSPLLQAGFQRHQPVPLVCGRPPPPVASSAAQPRMAGTLQLPPPPPPFAAYLADRGPMPTATLAATACFLYRQTARATAAASRSGPSGSGGSSRQGSAGTSRTDARASSMPRTAPAKSAIQAAERQLRVAAAATAPGGTAPGGDVATGIKQPVLSRLAQQCSSRIPTPSKPAGSRLLPSGTNTPVAAAPRPEGAGSSLAASRAPLLGSRRVPVHHESPSGSVDSANVTPNTARLRFLEQNPHLAFGCGTKLADSPDALQEAAAKKLTAEERHLLEWQHGHL